MRPNSLLIGLLNGLRSVYVQNICSYVISMFFFFSLPALPNSLNPEPRVLEIQVPASALQENKLHSVLTATPIIQSIMTLPPAVAANVLQQHINAVLASSSGISKQVDGTADTSDEDGSDVSDDNLDNDDDDDNIQVSSVHCKHSKKVLNNK